MWWKRCGFLISLVVVLTGCVATMPDPTARFGPDQLQEDLDILWQTYRQVHPSYDWYTPADSIDNRFRAVRSSLTDSLTEASFRLRLAWAVSAIRCGHTAVMPPRNLVSTNPSQTIVAFPLHVRVLSGDSLVVLQNMGPDRDSVSRGVVVNTIDSIPASAFIRQMRESISADGYNPGFADQLISAAFPARFKWMFGLKSSYQVAFTDSAGNEKQTTVRNFERKRNDSTRRDAPRSISRRPAYGFLDIDSTGKTAYLRLNTFSGGKVNPFIRRSFHAIEEAGVEQLILDLRNNSGGRIQKSVLLGRYLADSAFRVADSVSAVSLDFPYPQYVQAHWFYQMFGWVIASRGADGRLHMKSTERTWHKPKKKNHFDGPLYVLTSGRSFSATVLFLNYIQNRSKLVTVGEETGGSARGNSAVLIPDITLPNTGIRARLPLFRIVTRQQLPHNGRGFVPQVQVLPNSADIRQGRDAQLEAVKEMTRK